MVTITLAAIFVANPTGTYRVQLMTNKIASSYNDYIATVIAQSQSQRALQCSFGVFKVAVTIAVLQLFLNLQLVLQLCYMRGFNYSYRTTAVATAIAIAMGACGVGMQVWPCS